jgi:hypothetical protein
MGHNMTMRAALALALIIAASPAAAGSCRYQSVGDESVETCDNGFVEVAGPHGRRTYGIRNGGFKLYPGQNVPPWALERREGRGGY